MHQAYSDKQEARRCQALVLAAERHGLRLAGGPLFGTGHAFEDRLRLPYTQPPDVLRRAVDLLARAYVDAEATRSTDTAGRPPADPVV
jgi:hypothetical protein